MNPTHTQPAPTETPAAVVGMAAGAALTVLGAFLPWVVARVPLLGQVTVNGVEGDGKITLILAVVALITTGWRWRKPDAADRAAGALNFLIGVGIFFAGMYDFVQIDDAGEGVSVSAGNGLYLTVAAGLILMAAAATDFAQRLDKRR